MARPRHPETPARQDARTEARLRALEARKRRERAIITGSLSTDLESIVAQILAAGAADGSWDDQTTA